MSENISIDLYAERAKAEIDRWRAWWLDQSRSDPKNWPLNMPAGEWDEQFRAYSED